MREQAVVALDRHHRLARGDPVALVQRVRPRAASQPGDPARRPRCVARAELQHRDRLVDPAEQRVAASGTPASSPAGGGPRPRAAPWCRRSRRRSSSPSRIRSTGRRKIAGSRRAATCVAMERVLCCRVGSPRTWLAQAISRTRSSLEGIRFTAQVAVPERDPGAVPAPARQRGRGRDRTGADGLAVGFMSGLRRSYGDGPLWIRVAKDEALLLLGRDADPARARRLAGSVRRRPRAEEARRWSTSSPTR